MSHHKFQSYTYVIIGSGQILESKTIATSFDDSQNDEFSHRFSFVPSFDCAPRAKVIVYCLRNQSIESKSISVELNNFQNFIDLNVTSDAVKPGQLIDINVTSNPNSYIGLLGIDKSLLALRSGNDLDRDEIWNALEQCYTKVKERSYDYSDENPPPVPYYYNPWRDFSVSESYLC